MGTRSSERITKPKKPGEARKGLTSSTLPGASQHGPQVGSLSSQNHCVCSVPVTHSWNLPLCLEVRPTLTTHWFPKSKVATQTIALSGILFPPLACWKLWLQGHLSYLKRLRIAQKMRYRSIARLSSNALPGSFLVVTALREGHVSCSFSFSVSSHPAHAPLGMETHPIKWLLAPAPSSIFMLPQHSRPPAIAPRPVPTRTLNAHGPEWVDVVFVDKLLLQHHLDGDDDLGHDDQQVT